MSPMPTCLIIAATILNCTPAHALSPADALRVLTSNTQPFVAPLRIDPQYVREVPHDPAWPFLTPATPARPLAPPWSVTTYYGRNYLETRFNGRPFTAPVPGRDHRARGR